MEACTFCALPGGGLVLELTRFDVQFDARCPVRFWMRDRCARGGAVLCLSFFRFLLWHCGCFCRHQMGHLAYHLGLSRHLSNYLPKGQNFCREARSACFLHPYSAGEPLAEPRIGRGLLRANSPKKSSRGLRPRLVNGIYCQPRSDLSTGVLLPPLTVG